MRNAASRASRGLQPARILRLRRRFESRTVIQRPAGASRRFASWANGLPVPLLLSRRMARGDSDMLHTADVGVLGERAARRHLRRLGYRILATNHRSSAGEIDLIAMDRDTVVFAEVKTRTSRSGADPEANIAAGQIGRISRAARRFLSSSGAGNWPARLDLLTVMLEPDGPPLVEHFKGAFALDSRG